jgi:hypothetical protein
LNLREHARGQPCRVRLPGVCNGNPETTVLAHIKHGWYGSLKPPDIIAVHACSDCHDCLDRRRTDIPVDTVDLAILRGLCEMLDYYVKQKILKW